MKTHEELEDEKARQYGLRTDEQMPPDRTTIAVSYEVRDELKRIRGPLSYDGKLRELLSMDCEGNKTRRKRKYAFHSVRVGERYTYKLSHPFDSMQAKREMERAHWACRRFSHRNEWVFKINYFSDRMEFERLK